MRILVTGGSGFIGSHVVAHFVAEGHDVWSTDLIPPRQQEHLRYFKPCDLRNREQVRSLVAECSPDYILHLGARTDVFERHSLSGYSANIDGMQYLAEAANSCVSVRRIIVTSSRLVCRIGYLPASELDFCPPNFYGESKVRTEQITRAILKCDWVIVRPTAIWGPGFLVPSYRDFFEQIKAGRYFHVTSANPAKTFGYVKNTVFQLSRLLFAERDRVVGKLFYLGDYEPVHVRDWANQIACEFGRRPLRTMPRAVVRMGAIIGDLGQKMGVDNVPLNSRRFANMLCEAVHDMSELERITGRLPYSLSEATRETVRWLKANP